MIYNTTGNDSSTLNSTGPAACYYIQCLFSTVELVFIGTCSFLVILAGIIGNVCTGIVLVTSKKLRSISSFSIMSLALADLLLSTFVAPFVIVTVFFLNSWAFGLLVCKLYVFIQRVAVNAILLNLLVVSLERFLAVCFPFFLRLRKKLFLYAIIMVWFVAIVMSSPELFFMKLFSRKDGEFCFSTPTRKALHFRSFHDVFFFVAVAIIVPIQVITICCLRIRGAALRDNSQVNYKRRRNACYLLFLLMLSCVFCWFPVKISTIVLGNSNATQKLDPKSINTVLVVTFVLYFSCTVIHPIIFFFVSPKGKRSLKAIMTNARNNRNAKRSQQSSRLIESRGNTLRASRVINRNSRSSVTKETSFQVECMV